MSYILYHIAKTKFKYPQSGIPKKHRSFNLTVCNYFFIPFNSMQVIIFKKSLKHRWWIYSIRDLIPHLCSHDRHYLLVKHFFLCAWMEPQNSSQCSKHQKPILKSWPLKSIIIILIGCKPEEGRRYFLSCEPSLQATILIQRRKAQSLHILRNENIRCMNCEVGFLSNATRGILWKPGLLFSISQIDWIISFMCNVVSYQLCQC